MLINMGYIQLEDKIKISLEKEMTEENVMYILVETWKYCQRHNVENKYPFLRFFRNWVVHIEIDRLTRDISSILESSSKDKEKLSDLVNGLMYNLKEIHKSFSDNYIDNRKSEHFINSLVNILTEQPVNFQVNRFSFIINSSNSNPITWENIVPVLSIISD